MSRPCPWYVPRRSATHSGTCRRPAGQSRTPASSTPADPGAIALATRASSRRRTPYPAARRTRASSLPRGRSGWQSSWLRSASFGSPLLRLGFHVLEQRVHCLLLLALQLLQHRIEACEVRLPDAAVALDPIGRLGERPRLEFAGPALRLAAAGDQAGSLEDLEMLRDRGLRHSERRGELGDCRCAV